MIKINIWAKGDGSIAVFSDGTIKVEGVRYTVGHVDTEIVKLRQRLVDLESALGAYRKYVDDLNAA